MVGGFVGKEGGGGANIEHRTSSVQHRSREGRDCIVVEGARQNNLKGVDVRLPLNELIVVTGVSGSGKSSLAFDTVYSEGQRRYVETFSSYARQFLDRMDKPLADRIDGIPPAIAIDQTNPVRTSRSTVGTMTELNDHLKLLFARASTLYCGGCGKAVSRDSAESIYGQLLKSFGATEKGAEVLVTFRVTVPANFSEEEVVALLRKQGYTRIREEENGGLEVIQDRVRVSPSNRSRIVDDLEAALKHGGGTVAVYPLSAGGRRRKPGSFSSGLHCPDCGVRYRDPAPNLFSFNSPIGACPTCRGFGRTIGIDYGLVIPDETLSLEDGAVKPWQSQSYSECRDDLIRFAGLRGIPTDVPWREMDDAQRQWVIEGEGPWEDAVWYGAQRFFAWLEGRSYRMHIRVLLSRYRVYHECGDCGGARLVPEALLWRIGRRKLTIHDIVQLPIDRCHGFFSRLKLPSPIDEASKMLLGEIRTRLQYLVDVGLGYLTLDRQSRTLSGGEVQRINLTTALGTSLVNALFVLDEPSIGLHARDIRRLIRVLQKLRDAGNTLLVVEHDPDLIRAADRVIDMGPGPGERGGEVVFCGPLPGLLRCRESLTADYLTGRKKVEKGVSRVREVDADTGWLEIGGAAAHNLKGIDVRIPLNRLVCITGVSGSGKSTLVEDVCYRALRKLKHKPVDMPGRHREIRGHEQVGDVVLVDQAPIGKTTRSNPASYVGALSAIRKIFSEEPLSRERRYTPGTFSFNSGNGRCPACTGSGFEHVEMQFLSDVYLRCTDCDGTRFRSETLEVKLDGAYSISDVLEMTVSEACDLFADHADVVRSLEPLQSVGLGYIRLGQPVPTLSGGEAQRLKLAGFLAGKGRKQGGNGQGPTLFLFDEPTTGLHFDDVGTLLVAIRRLIESGHSAVIIEHNLSVIAAADWIVDLGPEGGEEGGDIVCQGPPEDVMRCRGSRTGAALRAERRGATARGRKRLPAARVREAGVTPGDGAIRIRNAREHNLRNVSLTIPRDRFTVITGISGSGKSTVAFDILFAEGQRRYLESLNAYARQFVQPSTRPDVDAILGIPPTVAIEQRTSRGGTRSTVATVTEIYHFIRLLFAKLGTQYCPDCGDPIRPQTPEAILALIMRDYRERTLTLFAPLVSARKGYYTDLAKWAAKRGATHLRVDGEMIPTEPWPRLDRYKEHTIDLPVGETTVRPAEEPALRALLTESLGLGKGTAKARSGRARDRIFSTERACPGCGRSFEEPDPRLFSFNSKHGWCSRCSGTGALASGRQCPSCNGLRLRPEALAVRYRDRRITDYTALAVSAADRLFRAMKFRKGETEVARDIVAELRSRLAFLKLVGLPYLTLDRPAPTLSGGEAQRIRLASQLGSNLRGVCYVLDEPTIGLHARDNLKLLDTLDELRAKGNTVVVVEHDETTIRRAEHVVDLGPGGGTEGGKIIATGTVDDLVLHKQSVTGRFLRDPLRHPLEGLRETGERPPAEQSLVISGARLHNLKRFRLRIPLGRLVCVTGVSGSGKSTLVRNIIHDNLRPIVAGKRRKTRKPLVFEGCTKITGWESLQRVQEVDQTPIGRTPRSCPATYVGAWSPIRKLYASAPGARMRGYDPSRFSFNVPGGRCEACGGQGMKRIEMSFLPNVSVPCDVCGGKRFNPETLAVQFREKNVADVLAMGMDEAAEFFDAQPSIRRAFRLLRDVGLGYLTLGQQSPTLSGGEAQRIKLVTELARANSGGALYVLDEPTIGLHMADVEKLIRVLHRLVDAGNSVLVIEHNLDVIAEADWIVDLGPEGGDAGGAVVAEGLPEDVAKVRSGSYTAKFLREFMKERSAAL